MFTLAHFSDPHLGPLPKPALRDLMGKRLSGYLSWHRRRRKLHKPGVLAALAEDLKDLQPGHVAITGDLTNISLPAEFTQTADWLRRLGAPDWISVVPGNHDAYVGMPWAESIGLWSDFMSHETQNQPGPRPEGAAAFPFVRRRGPLAIVGLSSACPTPLFVASGTLGRSQLERLEGVLTALGAEGCCRVVLIHHPPTEGATAARKRLVDSAAFRAVIARSGAELILHGHDHTFDRGEIAGPGGPAAVFGVPSASAQQPGRKPQAHYHLYDISAAESGWRVAVRVRGYTTEGGRFIDSDSYEIQIPRAAGVTDRSP